MEQGEGQHPAKWPSLGAWPCLSGALCTPGSQEAPGCLVRDPRVGIRVCGLQNRPMERLLAGGGHAVPKAGFGRSPGTRGRARGRARGPSPAGVSPRTLPRMHTHMHTHAHMLAHMCKLRKGSHRAHVHSTQQSPGRRGSPSPVPWAGEVQLREQEVGRGRGGRRGNPSPSSPGDTALCGLEPALRPGWEAASLSG